MGWNLSSPSGNDPVNTVDNTIRGDKETLLDALTLEHQFTTNDTTGYHLEGSARIYLVPTDDDLPTDTNAKREGRLCFVLGSTNLYYADGSNWTLLNATQNHKLESRHVGSLDIGGSLGPDWSTVSWGEEPNVNYFTTNFETHGGHIRMVLSVTAWAKYAPIYFNLKVDDENPPGTTLSGLGLLWADSSTKERGTVSMHWSTSRQGAGGVPPAGDPPAAGEHTVSVLWCNAAGGQGGLVGNMSHHLFLEEI